MLPSNLLSTLTMVRLYPASLQEWCAGSNTVTVVLFGGGGAGSSESEVIVRLTLVWLVALLSQFFFQRSVVIYFSRSLKDVDREAVVIVRGSRERLAHRLLDSLDGRHEPRVRHGKPPVDAGIKNVMNSCDRIQTRVSFHNFLAS